MSTHSVDVVCIKEIIPHPNADKLEIIMVEEFSCCVQKGSFKVGDLAAYVEPDYVVNTSYPEFMFLGKDLKVRIKPKRLRGVMSQGLLIPTPQGSQEGDNVMEQFGIVRYEPPSNDKTTGHHHSDVKSSGAVKGPEGYYPKYDLENWRKYSRLFIDQEPVQVTEKIHGANSRFVYQQNEMFCGSHVRWTKNDGNNSWSIALQQNSWIEPFCKNHPELTLYGEIYGWVQDLRYGARQGEIFFRVFDILKGNRWLNWDEIIQYAEFNQEDVNKNIGEKVLWVPLLAIIAYRKDLMHELVDGSSIVPGANNIREGIVIKPLEERNDLRLGRVALKMVSNEYLSRAPDKSECDLAPRD